MATSESDYEKRINTLLSAIDIAILAMQKAPPKHFAEQHVLLFIQSYNRIKEDISRAEPKHRNVTALRYFENDVFTFFQESSGEAVELFWLEIKKAALPYKRGNALKRVLKRGKIKSQVEYDLAIDLIVPYSQQGILNNEELKKLNELIGSFENR
jgi:hypothetical protein